MVRLESKRWNRLYPDILYLQQGLECVGLEYHNCGALYAEEYMLESS